MGDLGWPSGPSVPAATGETQLGLWGTLDGRLDILALVDSPEQRFS